MKELQSFWDDLFVELIMDMEFQISGELIYLKPGERLNSNSFYYIEQGHIELTNLREPTQFASFGKKAFIGLGNGNYQFCALLESYVWKVPQSIISRKINLQELQQFYDELYQYICMQKQGIQLERLVDKSLNNHSEEHKILIGL
ncbi:hypothetical protein ACSMFR_02675 [Listeria aquatica]|uniref:hypothetical protein n=1 Tax=Listeria aquatica TaxID=1494960 RepID=UPI003F6EF6EC